LRSLAPARLRDRSKLNQRLNQAFNLPVNLPVNQSLSQPPNLPPLRGRDLTAATLVVGE